MTARIRMPHADAQLSAVLRAAFSRDLPLVIDATTPTCAPRPQWIALHWNPADVQVVTK